MTHSYISFPLSSHACDESAAYVCETSRHEMGRIRAQFLSVILNETRLITEAWLECAECRAAKVKELNG